MEFLGSPSQTVPTLAESWKNFPILRLRFYLESNGMTLPPFQGAFWHSVIGMGLHQKFPKTYEALWQTEGPPRYAIHAPMLFKSKIEPGETISFDLTLFGDGTRHALHCMETLHEVALAGLGHRSSTGERGTARLVSVESVTPTATLPIFGEGEQSFALPTPFPTSEILSMIKGVMTCHINLLCDTPLHLKTDNRVCMSSPDFSLIVKRMLGRMNQFIPMPFTLEKKILIEQSMEIAEGPHEISWCDLHRWSARQGKDLLHGGIVGALDYMGEMTPFLPWLVLGQWLQLGSKTTFGFGAYRLGVDPS